MPIGLIGLKRPGNADCRGQLPHRMEFDHNIHLITNGAANFLKRQKRQFQFLSRDMRSLISLCSRIKWPNFHCVNPFFQKRLSQIVRSIQKSIQIIISIICTESVILGSLAFIFLDVIITCTSVVSANAITSETA